MIFQGVTEAVNRNGRKGMLQDILIFSINNTNEKILALKWWLNISAQEY